MKQNMATTLAAHHFRVNLISVAGTATGQSALWKYKAIYRLADQRIGQWSDVVNIPVSG
jgi:hypothetical protein